MQAERHLEFECQFSSADELELLTVEVEIEGDFFFRRDTKLKFSSSLSSEMNILLMGFIEGIFVLGNTEINSVKA